MYYFNLFPKLCWHMHNQLKSIYRIMKRGRYSVTQCFRAHKEWNFPLQNSKIPPKMLRYAINSPFKFASSPSNIANLEWTLRRHCPPYIRIQVRDKSILLLFLPIFLTYYAHYFARSFNILLKVKLLIAKKNTYGAKKAMPNRSSSHLTIHATKGLISAKAKN